MNNWTDEQLNAITKEGTNIIVSAGAGSGKTAVVTQRVLTKLKKGIHLNELLILTFTNNAAIEMKERIKKELKKDFNLKKELKYIAGNYITTFDAFALSLVKKYHLYLNISFDIKIIDSEIILLKKEEFLTNIFNQYFENNNELFLKFIDEFSIKNDNEIKRLLLAVNDQCDLLIEKEKYLNEYLKNYYDVNNINNMFLIYEKNIFDRIDSLENILSKLKLEVSNEYYTLILRSLNYLFEAKKYEDLGNNLNIVLPPLPKNSNNKAKIYKSQISKILGEINKFSFDNKEILIKDILSTKDNVKIIIEILIKLDEQINNFKSDNNIYEFNDISKMAFKLIKNNEEILNKIKEQYQEIIIDEYQDTSDIQEAFISLINQNNTYMVGDIKQSIYRFRNANPDIFKSKYDNYRDLKNGIKIDLNKNFRSRDTVLNAINLIFNHIMDDMIGNANYKDEHQMIFGNTAYLDNKENNNLTILNYKPDNQFSKEEYEAFIIAEDIKTKINNQYQIFEDTALRPCQYSDFCILMDRNNAFEIYKKVFDYLKIPIKMLRDENIIGSDEIFILKNIISLIIAIKNKEYDNINFYYTGIARSYLFNLNDQEIYSTVINSTVRNSEIFKICKNLALDIDRMSNYNFILKIIESFKFYNKFINAGNIKYRNLVLNNILDKAKSLNEIGITIKDFNNFLDTMINTKKEIKISPINTENNSVILTNIHKSKGLEYNICYYSGLYKDFYLKDIKERIIFNNKFGLIIPAYYEGYKPCFTSYLNKESFIKAEISEKLRLFYVALTRAREKIIIICPLEEPEIDLINNNSLVDYIFRLNYRSFKDILESIYSIISEYIENINLPIINENYKRTIKLSIDNIPIINDNFSVIEKNYIKETIKKDKYSKEQCLILDKLTIDKMEYGKKLHYLLEITDFVNPDYSTLNKKDKIYIENFLKLEILKNIKKAKIFKEYEFIYKKDNKEQRGIIDLIIEYDDHINIIDYKLKNIDDEGYKEQLTGYKNYIFQKKNKPVGIYLYSIYDKKLIQLD